MSSLKFFSNERLGKTIIYILMDILILLLSILLSIWLWYDIGLPGSISGVIPQSVWPWFLYMSIFGSFVVVTVYALFHMYNNLWKYASIDEIFKIFVACSIVFIILFCFDVIYLSPKGYIVTAKRMLFVAWAINTILFTGSRFGYRLVKRCVITASHLLSSKSGRRRVMVVGAGFSGYGAIRGMLNSRIKDKIPVIVVDGDATKNNSSILGVRVLTGYGNIPELVAKYQIDEIIIAKPDAEPLELREIVENCTKTDCTLKIMPPMSELEEGQEAARINLLRDVNISDLLFREEINLDVKNIKNYLAKRTILVTGGGGSIGSELCRQIARFEPGMIVIFDIYENNAYQLMVELQNKYGDKIPVFIRIGSVRDMKRLENVFQEFKPHVVFHAAAHKHVSLMEESPWEAVKNNVFGTMNVVQCADRFHAEKFVLLSSDKAVNPTNVMGATKRITELIIQDMASRSKTKYMAVRFGNVLGSNGSVIPLFKQQIQSGGPVTITHPDMERYFMTIPEACQLVLQAAGLGQTGKIFILNMGEPIKILDLAKNLIKLSGLHLDKDIEIKYIGLRPGEKLYEELIMEEEKDGMQVTCHKKIIVAKPVEMDHEKFHKQLAVLKKAAESGSDRITAYLQEIVPNYNNTRLE